MILGKGNVDKGDSARTDADVPRARLCHAFEIGNMVSGLATSSYSDGHSHLLATFVVSIEIQ